MDSADSQQRFLAEILELSTDVYWPATRPELETLACYLTQPGWLIAQDPAHPYHTMLLACLQHLRECFPVPELLSVLAADAYFRSARALSGEANFQEALLERQLLPLTQDVSIQEQLANVERLFLPVAAVTNAATDLQFSRDQLSIQQIDRHHGLRLLRLLNACLWQYPPPDLDRRVEAFLEPLDDFGETQKRARGISAIRWQDCLHLLSGLPSSRQLPGLLTTLRQVCLTLSDSMGFRIYADEQPLFALLHALSVDNLLTYEFFSHAAFLRPSHLMHDVWLAENDPVLHLQVEAYQNRLIREVAQQLDQENFFVILAFGRPLSGSDWLLAAASAHSRLQLEELIGTAGPYSPATLAQAIIRLARAEAIEPADEPARSELVARLRGFPQSTLKALVGVAVHARRLLCEALDWQEAIPLVELVERLAEPVSDENGTDGSDSDALDISLVREVLALVNITLAEEVLAILVRGRSNVESAATLVRAVGGWNRASIQQGLKRNSHLSIKAYGLLPLTRGEDEVMERYLEFQRQTRIGQNFGMGRRASHAAAIETAMLHLAQIGGYRDAAHLEWEMEARIVNQATGARAVWTVGAYTFQIGLEGAQVSIQVAHDGRAVKSVPQEVRTSAIYKKEAKEALARMHAYVSRVKRGLLERLLVTGEPLAVTELARLLEMPIVRALLITLVWCDIDGTMGLLEPGTLELCDLDGTHHPLLGPVAVAHPYHFLQTDTLSAWQRFLVHHKLVQPIKQVFRELYVLTPAEQQTVTFSRRFRNHTLNGSIAHRLLTGRNWRVIGRSSTHPLACKTFSGIRASFELSHDGHYLGEGGSVAVTGIIFFERLWTAASAPGIVPLAEVPPLIFSEVMRDIDLVVSVAQSPVQENQAYLSPEIFERTGEIVSTLLDELQLPGVTIAGHFAFVQGQLACYRVHLGSAAIHIEPGGYLCIVPARWGQTHEQLFLPFVDEDARVGEVISKILLLLADDQIKDESILRQIKRTSLT